MGLKVSPDVFEQLVEIGMRSLIKTLSIDERQAEDLMIEIANDFFGLYEGQSMYMAKNMAFRRSKRDDEIWESFNGTNQAELAAVHGVTVIHLYRIIAAKRKEARRKNQPLLPGFEEADSDG